MKKTIVFASVALLALLVIGAGTNAPSSFSNPGVDSKSLAKASFGFVDAHGNTRIGYGSETDLSAASNCVIIGDFSNSQFVAGSSILIGGANGGSSADKCVAIGRGAGAAGGEETHGRSDGSIAIGDQTDAFGRASISIGVGMAGIRADECLALGVNIDDVNAGANSNCLSIGFFQLSEGDIHEDNKTVIGDGRMNKTLIYGTNIIFPRGKLIGNGGSLTNVSRYGLYPQSASAFSSGTHHFIGWGGLDSATEANVSTPASELSLTVSNVMVRFSNLVAGTNAVAILVTNGSRSSYSNSVSGAGATTMTISGAFTVPAGATVSWEVYGNNPKDYAGNVSFRQTLYEPTR